MRLSIPKPHALGHVAETGEVTVFFGNRNATAEDIASAFPDFKMIFVKQTHSNIVVESPFQGEPPEADAHFTQAKKLALCIRTADCIPVLIHDPVSGFAAAIHAGWRGVENEVIRKSIERLHGLGVSLASARAWLGPHIAAASFEVGKDVAASLEARFDAVRGFSNKTTSVYPHASPGKAYVDLSIIAKAQLGASGIDAERVTQLSIDTFMSPEHASYRRDGSGGRQISFISLR